MVSIEWLEKINIEFIDNDIEHRKRPMEALRRYGLEFGGASFPSPIATEIFEWFKYRTKPITHQAGNLFESVYYFDTEFWSLSIPIMFGTVPIKPTDCLKEMSPAIKSQLIADNDSLLDYIAFFSSCIDYGMNIGELVQRNNLHTYGIQLMKSGNEELQEAVSLLRERIPNKRAILSCRNATEMFLKAYIAFKVGLTVKEAKKLNHHLDECFKRFVEVSSHPEWIQIESNLSVFPPIDTRYNPQEEPLENIWKGFAFAQLIATTIVREIV